MNGTTTTSTSTPVVAETLYDKNGNLKSSLRVRRKKGEPDSSNTEKQWIYVDDDTESESSDDEYDAENLLAEPIVTPHGMIESDPIPPKYQGRAIVTLVNFIYPIGVFIRAITCGLPSNTVLFWAALLWYGQIVGVTVSFHRYYSHKSYKACRAWEFFFGVLGCMSGQKGPLFWASQHRWHHKHCEKKKDVHSPYRFGKLDNPLKWIRGFMWSQGFFLWQYGPPRIDKTRVPDLLEDKLAVMLEIYASAIHYSLLPICVWFGGFEAVVWVFAGATSLSWNCVQFVNSFSHICGTRDYECRVSPICNSRNVWWLSLVIFGDNWHNNHHAYSSSVRQGFHW